MAKQPVADEKALLCVSERNYAAAIAWAMALPGPIDRVQALSEMLMHAYWECKDLEGVLALGSAGERLALAEAAQHPAEALRLKRKAAVIAHNLASFCWPGWDEPGILIAPEALRQGREAASRHFGLAQELQFPDLQQARAWWIVGAHEMSTGDWARARNCFENAAARANLANSPEDRDLFRGYVCLVDLLADPAAPRPHERLFAHKSTIANAPYADEVLQQLEQVEAYFKRHS